MNTSPIPADASGAANVSGEAARAYDAIAPDYDGLLDDDRWMRYLLWRRYSALFAPGDRVLDVACGTGIDTLHLAANGVNVTGIDISPGMLGALREKAQTTGLAHRVDTRIHDAAVPWPFAAGTFDGMVSTFSGLNTVTDLRAYSTSAARVLRPGANAVLHALCPAGLWRRLYCFARHGPRAAHRLAWEKTYTKRIRGVAVAHHLFSPGEVYGHYFAGNFELKREYALGFLWPQRAGCWLPHALLRAAGTLEPHLGRLPGIKSMGRFITLELVRR
ncbi:MAG: methyltransferase domain-containing protein [Gammaproteobacteria bacterium]|nr:methyltransferase domain-containing protein [Gammaproteobacteria bacterium]